MQREIQLIGEYWNQFIPLIFFILIATILASVAISLPFIGARKNPYEAKKKGYECGFEQLGKTRNTFNIRFYIVAILFVIFDVEIIFMVPWALNIKHMETTAFYGGVIFIVLMILGLIYEWKKGALENR